MNLAWNKVGPIIAIQNKPESERKMYYIRGILRNRMYVNEGYVMQMMRDAVADGVSIEEIEDYAKCERNWTNFQSALVDAVERVNGS